MNPMGDHRLLEFANAGCRLPSPLRRAAMLAVSAFALVGSTPLASAAEPTSRGQTIGYVITSWKTAMHESLFMDECPEGPAEGAYEIWESTLSPEQRRTYPMPPVTQMRWVASRGPNGEDVCENPTVASDPPLKIVEGKYAYGLNLDGNTDGSANPKSCKHRTFTSPTGEAGIDNQMYRLLGCTQAWRSDGHIENNANSHRRTSGLGMILVEVSGVDDVMNDDDVVVTFYRGIGSFSLDGNNNVLPYGSYDIDDENGVPRYGDKVQGRIEGGILTTAPADVSLPHFGNYEYLRQLIRDMQMHVDISTEDGRTSGMVYGYYGVEQFYSYVRGLLSSFPIRHKYNCPSIYVAAHELADGHPDPETGACTTLSSAFAFEAVRAFINRPKSVDVAAAAAARDASAGSPR